VTNADQLGLTNPGAVGALHERFVHGRRVRVLATHLAALIPPRSKVLDVGCGDGTIDSLILQQRPDVFIEGIDVLVRPTAKIPVRRFDGTHIPYPDAQFDSALLVDVLHHADDPLRLLQEASRVGKSVVIKDVFRDGFLAAATLRFMDWVGNAHHGVALPYNFWSKAEWDAAFNTVGLKRVETRGSLGLYPVPASWFFERDLHFMSRFERQAASSGTNTLR
jgi:SAM-dependent methyltransferase